MKILIKNHLGKEIGITVSKENDFSEWFTQVVIKAELADYAPVKGLIVLRPDGYSIWESLKMSLDKKFENLFKKFTIQFICKYFR